jgi:hypothetical protein
MLAEPKVSSFFRPFFGGQLSSRTGSDSTWTGTHLEGEAGRQHLFNIVPLPGLPRTGVFDPSETIDYLKQVRDKMLAEPKVSSF